VALLDERRAFSVIDIQSEDYTQIRTKNQHKQRFDVGVKNKTNIGRCTYCGTTDMTYISVVLQYYILLGIDFLLFEQDTQYNTLGL